MEIRAGDRCAGPGDRLSFHRRLVRKLPNTAGDDVMPSVNARDLHAALLVGRDFPTWITGRIAEYGFVEGRDYATVDSPDRGNQTGRGGDRRSKEYFVSLDMAKELGMVEKNEAGRRFLLHKATLVEGEDNGCSLRH